MRPDAGNSSSASQSFSQTGQRGAKENSAQKSALEGTIPAPSARQRRSSSAASILLSFSRAMRSTLRLKFSPRAMPPGYWEKEMGRPVSGAPSALER